MKPWAFVPNVPLLISRDKGCHQPVCLTPRLYLFCLRFTAWAPVIRSRLTIPFAGGGGGEGRGRGGGGGGEGRGSHFHHCLCVQSGSASELLVNFPVSVHVLYMTSSKSQELLVWTFSIQSNLVKTNFKGSALKNGSSKRLSYPEQATTAACRSYPCQRRKMLPITHRCCWMVL